MPKTFEEIQRISSIPADELRGVLDSLEAKRCLKLTPEGYEGTIGGLRALLQHEEGTDEQPSP